MANICPSILPATQNSYSKPPQLTNKKVILSREGTPQGDPLAMAVSGIATLALIKLVNDNSLSQKWYADDKNAVGNLKSLLKVLTTSSNMENILDIM